MAKRMSMATLKRWWRTKRTQSYRAISGWLRSVLRPVFRAWNQPQNSRSGFVLPTAALLLLVVSLVIGAVLLRTINRTEQVIGIREEKVIYNAATPAIDRAKAKIEYMFTQDTRLPAGVPSEERLYEMMLNKASAGAELDPNPYLIPGEELIKINSQEAPAWAYREDSDGDGQDDLTIAYSITWKFPTNIADLEKTKENDIKARAQNLEVRNGPMSGDPTSQCKDIRNEDLPPIEAGFLTDPTSTAILRKNFQIDAFVISDKENGTVTALEMQQDRQANRGNKWGAWFRSDLELFPGPFFNWNGAIRTDGSLFVGRDPDRANKPRLNAYLVSSPASCIYQAGKDNSIISLGQPPSNTAYQGQVVSALINIDTFQGTSAFHVQTESFPGYKSDLDSTKVNPETDSVNNVGSPSDVAVNPLVLFTEDRSEYRDKNLKNVRDQNWGNRLFVKEGRVTNEPIDKPVVDDFYRADDRYGPKPAYGTSEDDTLIALNKKVGEPITGQPRFTTLNPVSSGTSDDATDLGLDGYWERRAFREGMRVITGQRLELGNDPLPDPTDYDGEDIDTDPNNSNNVRQHEALQRRALRDNPAAVQATAIYHHSGSDGDLPVAALATTVHPGTAETLKRSSIFDRFDYEFKTSGSGNFGGTFGDTPDEIPVDFFTGRGTNGWEFAVPNSFFANADVSKALQNLANFAGDPDGAFPPKQEAGRIHPYPQLTKWGNFSNLRRTLNNNLDSLADKTNEHTAALTLGMLAYNLQYLEAFNYKDAGNRAEIRKLDEALQDLDNLACNPFETACTDYDRLEDGEVDFYKTEDLYGPGLPNLCSPANNTVRDSQDTAIGEKSLNGDADCADPIQTMFVYDTKQAQANKKVAIARTPGNLPEAYQAGLEQRVKTATNAQLQQRIKDAQLARLLYLKEQTKRDRTYGFRASPQTPGQFQYKAKYFDAANLNDPDAFTYGGISYGTEEAPYDPNNDNLGQVVNFNCNFGPFPTGNNNSLGGNNYFGLFTSNPVVDGANPPKDAEEEKQFIRVATAICGINEDADSDGLLDIAPPANNEDLNGNGKLDGIKYPSLFYLFPLEAHNHLATGLDATKRQPAALVPNTVNPDPFLTDTYIQGLNNNYQQIVELNGVALKPKPIAQWTLPHETINPANACDNDHAAANPNPNCSQYNVIIAKNRDTKLYEAHRVALKDTALFNGREMMNVRVLNLDLEMLKEEKTPGGDTWLAGGNDKDSQAGGIVFAFREDAVREDAIARPAGAAWSACNTVDNITNPGCRTDATDPQDPPVNTANGISPKPVDFYPDPDRRPHGFRLINGSDVSHPKEGGVVNYGLTFVSDNSAYIQGDFNCHKSPGGNCDKPIEEFRQTISDTDPSDANYVNEFYDRRNPQYKVFANPDSDSWRTSELLVDALTILSDNFCDGSIEDGIITVTDGINPGMELRTHLGNGGLGRSAAVAAPTLSSVYGCSNPGTNYTSYLNQNRPNDPGMPFNGWLRENPADPASPIKLSANGNPLLALGEDYTGNYFQFTDGNAAGELRLKPLSKASPQRVNAVIISGTVPFRALQSSGGLHNFPRFLENWDGVPLNISGSLLQLNFSTAATAPWDPDAWEPGGATVAKDQYGYYMAPERLWGYDVALQLVSAGPISTRLINVSKSRSEYYRELPLDDPYINNLRCSTYNGKRIDPRADANGDCN